MGERLRLCRACFCTAASNCAARSAAAWACLALAHGRFHQLGPTLPAARPRATPPVAIGGVAVVGVDDLADGSSGLPATEALRYRLASGARVIVRPSGTEPVLRITVEARDTVSAAHAAERLERAALEHLT